MINGREYASFDATALAARVRSGDVSPAELLEAALRAADADRLNAIAHRMDDDAGRAVAAGLPPGPFRGVPFLLKDSGVAVAGHPTSHGSRLFAGARQTADSEMVRRYRKAGFSLFGLTNTPELAMCCNTEPKLHGATLNPWDPARSPGGSSGGAAAAVAAGIVPAAHGTDAAGSLRIPASDCGVFGLMPSRGRIGLGPGSDPLGTGRAHVLTRSVRDSAAILDATLGTVAGEPFFLPAPERPYAELVESEKDAPLKGLRIACAPEHPGGGTVDEQCRQAVQAAATLCESLGHHVEIVQPPLGIEPLLEAAPLLCFLRAMVDARLRELGRPLAGDDLERTTRALYDYAGTVTGADYLRAVQAVHRCAYGLGRFFERHDLVLTPVTAAPPRPLGSFDMDAMDFEGYRTRLYRGHMPFTRQFNFSGGPAMAIPMHRTADGLPVGVQFGAAVGREDLLFRIAAQIEAARPWPACAPAATSLP